MIGNVELLVSVVIKSIVLVVPLLVLIAFCFFLVLNKKKVHKLNYELEELKTVLRQKEDSLQTSFELRQKNDNYFPMLHQETKITFNSINRLLDVLLGEFDFLSNEEKIGYILQMKGLLITSSFNHENIVFIKSLEKNNKVFNPKTIAVFDYLSYSVKEISQFADMKRISFGFDVEPGLEVYVDPEIMSIVLRSLINIIIEKNGTNSKILVQAVNTAGIAKISFNNFPTEINEEVQSMLFSNNKINFTKVMANLTSSEVGLLLAKELIVISGGDLWFYSSFDEGAKLTFSLPVNKEKNI